MKTSYYTTVLGLLLACAVLTLDARVERTLKQTPIATASATSSCDVKNGDCYAKADVTSTAADDAAKSIARSLASAIAFVEDGTDVKATAFGFAEAIAEAFATIISSHTLYVYNSGSGSSCAYSESTGEASASAISKAVSSAFAKSSNKYAKAAADCFSKAVSAASLTAFQKANFGTCVSYGYDYIYFKVVTIGYVQTVATASSKVLTAIKDNNAEAAAKCESSGTSFKGVTTTVESG